MSCFFRSLRVVVSACLCACLCACLRFLTCTLLLAGLLLYNGAVQAQSQTKSQAETVEEGVLDEIHTLLSERFIRLANDLDGLFGGPEDSAYANESWLRLRLELRKFDSESPQLRGNVKLKLVLPNTEERLRLLLSTEDDDILDPGEIRDGIGTTASDANNVSFALRFLQSARDKASIKFDVGARFRDSELQAFGRINASHAFIQDVQNGRDLSLINNFWLFSASGYENRLKLNFTQEIKGQPDRLLQSRSEIIWKNNEPGARFVQLAGAYSEFSDNIFAGLETIANVATATVPDENHLRSIELRIRYRQNIWRDWFFFEVWPRVRWESQNDYESRFGLLLRAEVFLDPSSE